MSGKKKPQGMSQGVREWTDNDRGNLVMMNAEVMYRKGEKQATCTY